MFLGWGTAGYGKDASTMDTGLVASGSAAKNVTVFHISFSTGNCSPGSGFCTNAITGRVVGLTIYLLGIERLT
jgi:hypothetical protein